MSIPYNDNLSWNTYTTNPKWHEFPNLEPLPSASSKKDQALRAVNELAVETFKQFAKRGVQFIRDALRLVLKVAIRAIKTPFFLGKNWKEWERAKINAKLTGNSFMQFAAVTVKCIAALLALITSVGSMEGAKRLLDKSDNFTAYQDGLASRLEALKEEGCVNASDYKELEAYRAWLDSIDPRLCRKANNPPGAAPKGSKV